MENIKECLGWLRDKDKRETSTSDLGGEDTALEIVNCDNNAESTGMLIQSPSSHKAMIYSKETLPHSLYKVSQHVYALCQRIFYWPTLSSLCLKVMWGPKADKIDAGFCSPLALAMQVRTTKMKKRRTKTPVSGVQSAMAYGLHYYMPFMGWAVKWDQWAQEEYLYEDSAFTVSLSKLLSREYNKVKPKKKGKKISLLQIQV
jgi:hypothetical protein